ncbi:MAG: HAMP domain-containing protein, partial [Sneathiella sp.]|nr:HAMP domain-containing protein [Sneathiella sp.]
MRFVSEKLRLRKSVKKEKSGGQKKGRVGIRLRLYAAFGAIALLTLIAGVVGWTQFNNLGQTLQRTTSNSLGSMELAFKLSQGAKEVVSAVPGILKASSKRDLGNQSEVAKTHLATLDEAVVALYSEDIDTTLMDSIQEQASALESGILDLENNVSKLLEHTTASRDFSVLTTMRHKAVTEIIEPYVETLRQDMSAESMSLSFEDDLEKVQDGMTKLIDEDVEVYARAINLMSNLNMSAALLERMNSATSLSQLKELQEQFTIYSTRLRVSLLLPDFEGKAKLTDQVTKLADSAEADKGVIVNRQEYLKTLAKTQHVSFTLQKNAEELGKIVSQISTQIDANTTETIAKADEDIAMGKMKLGAISVASVVFALLIAWLYVGRNLMRRLNTLVLDMSKIADGDLNTEVDVRGTDEITEMANALVGFRDNAKEAERMRTEAERQRIEREEAEEHAEKEARAAEERARAEKERLEKEAEEQRRQELAQLANDFEGSVKHLVESFASATTQMAASSEVMSHTASETEQRSSSVSAASEVASASVDSVAAATEELTSSINEISRQVGQASNIANSAVSEAERTNQMV